MVLIVVVYSSTEKISKLKADNKYMNFPTQFCLGSICENFDCVRSEKVQIKEIIYDFSVDFDAISKSEVLAIHEYLMDKNNIKYIWTY